MRIAISNIAWDVAEDNEIATILHKYNVDAIDIAPGKYFADLFNASRSEVLNVKNFWAERNIEITGMQALLFGTTGFNLFGSEGVRAAMLEHLKSVCRVGSLLGATRLVFGSPKNRDRTGLNDEQTMEQALSFFLKLGEIALEYGVIICLEPNPSFYGANFMTTSKDTAHVVRALNHPAIKMQLDTGALLINQESIDMILADCIDIIGHVHLSEPNLVTLGDSDTDHFALHASLNKFGTNRLVAIEMLATKNESHLVSIDRALSIATQYYRPSARVAI